MNPRLPVKLFITALLLVATQGVQRNTTVPQKTPTQIADGGGCIPWTPESCPKPQGPS